MTLDIDALEAVYDQLAHAIDQAGPQHESLFLVKLALLCAQRTGDATGFKEDIDQALLNLP